MEEPTIRQRMSLSDQLSLLHSSNLRTKTLTLAAILEAEKNSDAAGVSGGGGRTLLDVIREEEEESRGSSSRWRDLTGRLRIRSPATWIAGSASTPALEGPDVPIRVSLSTLMELREREEEEERMREVAVAVALAEVDGEDDGGAEEGEGVHVCCVCMVRKKGAAFIPCGHTFCRICSREMMGNRGNCPLCNVSILDVLDIF